MIPAYNEAHCIAESLAGVMAFARDCPAVCEVIVVDDGSTDGTSAIVEALRPEYESCPARLRLIRSPRNLGKGVSVRKGVLAATGDVVLFTDADLSTPMCELPRLVRPIVEGRCDVVVGSRAINRRLIAVRQGRFRETAGKLFNLFVRCLTGLYIRDTQCGFKAFRRPAILPVFEVQRIARFAFDAEILYLAARRGLRIREIPVRWSHAAHTKVDMLRDSVGMFLDVLRIRMNDLCGAYRGLFRA